MLVFVCFIIVRIRTEKDSHTYYTKLEGGVYSEGGEGESCRNGPSATEISLAKSR